MTARAAAIARGEATRTGLAARAPSPLHVRHIGPAAGAHRGALSRLCRRPRRPVHLSRSRPARRLCHARSQAPRAGCAPLRRHASRNGSSARSPTFGVRGERREDRVGVWVRAPRQGRRRRGQDRRHRHPRSALGDAARLFAQCRAGPVALFRHRSVRRVRAEIRRHVAGRSRPAGVHARRRPRAAGRVRAAVRRNGSTLKRSPARKTDRPGGAAPNPRNRPRADRSPSPARRADHRGTARSW